MKANRAALFGVLLCLAIVPLGAGCGALPERREAKVHGTWPFDANEARRRQEETANALGVPVEKTVDLGGGVKMEFVLIPAGEFLMGSRDPAAAVAAKCHEAGLQADRFEDEHPQHRVRITKPFYIGKYEVTRGQWERVMASSPSQLSGAKNPVERVSWNDCQEFVKKLSGKCEGLTFGLPTEAEWEYACRAGTATPFHFGETISTDQANYNGDYTYGSGRKGAWREQTVPVGSFPANAFELYDLHGNVWEWCQDWYGEDYYKQSPKADPQGPSGGKHRAMRGGSWFFFPWYCRSAYRSWCSPSSRYFYVGCRPVLRDF